MSALVFRSAIRPPWLNVWLLVRYRQWECPECGTWMKRKIVVLDPYNMMASEEVLQRLKYMVPEWLVTWRCDTCEVKRVEYVVPVPKDRYR